MLRARAWLRFRSNWPMPLFYFRIRTGRFSGASGSFEFVDQTIRNADAPPDCLTFGCRTSSAERLGHHPGKTEMIFEA